MIRPYVEEDLEALLDVWYRASQIAHSFLTEDFFESERREMQRTQRTVEGGSLRSGGHRELDERAWNVG